MAIEEFFPQTKRFKLKQLCAARWIDRHDVVLLYEEIQPTVLDALNSISFWEDVSTSANQIRIRR